MKNFTKRKKVKKKSKTRPKIVKKRKKTLFISRKSPKFLIQKEERHNSLNIKYQKGLLGKIAKKDKRKFSSHFSGMKKMIKMKEYDVMIEDLEINKKPEKKEDTSKF